MKKSDEQKLFELIDEIGETLDGDLHIINHNDIYPEYEGDQKWRVYEANGHCFDVTKLANTEENGDFKNWEYDFSAEWEGFAKVKTAKQAMRIIEKSKKTLNL